MRPSARRLLDQTAMKTLSLFITFSGIFTIFGTPFVGAVEKIDTPAWESHFRMYNSADEAREAYVKSIEPTVARYSGHKEPRPVLPAGDSRYAVAEKTVESVFSQFQKLQPDRFGKMAPPPVVLVEDNVPNAYAISAAAANDTLIPYMFAIQTGLFDQGLTEDAVHGIVAHELAHLLLRHVSPDVSEKMKKYYVVSGSETKYLGFLMNNDDRLERLMRIWLNNANDVGPSSNPRIRDVPFALAPGFDLMRALEHLAQNYTKDEGCKKTAFAALMIMRLNILSTFDQFTMRFDLSPDGINTLDDRAKDIRKKIATCQTEKKLTLGELYEEFTGIKFELILRQATPLQKQLIARDEKIFAAAPNAFEGIFHLVRSKRLEMRTIERKVDLRKVRIYGSEEEADDASVQVLQMLGRDPAGIAQFFAGLLSESDRKKCLAIIKSGKAPSYGDLPFPHHSHCYRIYHAKLVAHKLKGRPWKKALNVIASEVK